MSVISGDLYSVPRFTFTCRNAAGALADPTTFTVTVTTPSGVATAYVYATDIAVVRSSVGVFYIDVTLSETGRWSVVPVAVGAVADSDSVEVIVGLSHSYCTYDEFIGYMAGTAGVAAVQEPIAQLALNATARAIDNYCDQRFWLDPTPVARTFEPWSWTDVRFEGDGIGSSAGVIVATDEAGDGIFETAWTATDYQLVPVDALYGHTEPRVFTGVRAVGALTFPRNLPFATSTTGRPDRVQVTARWGWPQVPATVIQACLLKASRLYGRRMSPQGVIDFNQFGPVRITRAEDPDVAEMLGEYRVHPVPVA